MKKYLIVNTGSVSSKYSLYTEEKEIFFGHFEIEAGKAIVTYFNGGRNLPEEPKPVFISDEIFNNSLEAFIREAIKENIISNKEDITSIGIRTVAPGTYFQSDRIVSDEFIAKITDMKEEAPLHIAITLKEIEGLKKILPQTPIVGISDSAFHKDEPETSRLYAIPQKIAKDLDIYHFGYHGISVGSIVKKLEAMVGRSGKTVICHIGGGSSVTAIQDGKSFDTSMGYSPLQGLMSSTRAGDIDPVAAIHMAEILGKTPTEFESYLNKESGLLGISQVSSDVRDLIAAEKEGNTDAALALNKFVIAIKKYIGAYAAEMDGIDTLVFSGTIGERSFIMRERICKELDFLGIILDEAVNNNSVAVDAEISIAGAKVKVLVVCTNEMQSMADQLKKFII